MGGGGGGGCIRFNGTLRSRLTIGLFGNCPWSIFKALPSPQAYIGIALNNDITEQEESADTGQKAVQAANADTDGSG